MGNSSKVHKKAKEDRLKRRRQIGPLAKNRITPAVYSRYSRSVMVLFQFWFVNEMYPSAPSEIDDKVACFVEAWWAEGEPYYVCSNALAALQFFLPLKGKLTLSWDLLKTWHKKEPPVRVMPMHPLLLLGMAAYIARQGFIDVAALMITGFDAILRSGEIYRLRVGDILFSGEKAVLNLRDTKTSQVTGTMDMVICESAQAVTLLRAACQDRHRDLPVLQVSPSKFRKLFQEAAIHFGFTDRLTVYSLRRGGATWSFLQHGSMEKCLLRGRWQSTKTARIYLQDAVAGMSDLQLSDSIRNKLQAEISKFFSP